MDPRLRWLHLACVNPVEATDRLMLKAEALVERLTPTRMAPAAAYRHLARQQPLPSILMVKFEEEFDTVWSSIEVPGMGKTRHSHDADRTLALAVYSAVRLSGAEVVVETGVARGFTSRVVLEALARNQGDGRLISVDLPPLSDEWAAQSRVAVPQGMRARWTYLRATSRAALPRIGRRFPRWDLFIHDSGHTYRNMRMELALATKHVPPGGWIFSDDADTNTAFLDVIDASPQFVSGFVLSSTKPGVIAGAQRVY